MAETRIASAGEFVADGRNANRGTERGRDALEASLRSYGAGRSILVDKNGRIIAGNKTLEAAARLGLDNVVVVSTDGKQIVAVQRTDLDLDVDEEARMLAYADNRVAELDLNFDPVEISLDLDSGLDLGLFWSASEIDELLDTEEKTTLEDAGEGDSSRKMGDTKKQIKPVLYAEDVADFERAIRATGQKNRGAALLEVCRFYLEAHAEGQFYVGVEGLFAA